MTIHTVMCGSNNPVKISKGRLMTVVVPGPHFLSYYPFRMNYLNMIYSVRFWDRAEQTKIMDWF